jgi:hypothetical protein
MSPRPLDTLNFAGLNIIDRIKIIFRPTKLILNIKLESQHHFQHFATTSIDLIWMPRNHKFHNEFIPIALIFSKKKKKMNTSYQHHSPQSLERPHSQSYSLVSPLPSFINVNFDVDNPNSFSTLAAISTNYDGSILFALATLGPS